MHRKVHFCVLIERQIETESRGIGMHFREIGLCQDPSRYLTHSDPSLNIHQERKMTDCVLIIVIV